MHATPETKFGQTHFVFVNGKKYLNCIEADDKVGYADIVVGRKENFAPIVERIYGKIEFVSIFNEDPFPYEAMYE